MKILLIEPAKAPGTIGEDEVFLYEPLGPDCFVAAMCRRNGERI
jgi:hypothetical protein